MSRYVAKSALAVLMMVAACSERCECSAMPRPVPLKDVRGERGGAGSEAGDISFGGKLG